MERRHSIKYLVVKQYYEVQVYDEYVIRGNTAVLTCHVPSFVKDYVTVTSWIRDDVLTVASTVQEGEFHSLHLSRVGITSVV
ncbi:hypothetical protein AVEN_76524-1 [Araneus ventricosus]|uniref:Ig-like domain-containing protein n=1 Tax=Araneus ventricosus TaxID=182803 RepID=A0A4Y2CDS2_ARAVE|nr:hypothetical protein AVEN_76524-1 [Araneus ventricosus]